MARPALRILSRRHRGDAFPIRGSARTGLGQRPRPQVLDPEVIRPAPQVRQVELAARHLYCYSSFGEQWHRWAWTRARLTAALTAACLGDIEEEHARAWHNLRFKARKG